MDIDGEGSKERKISCGEKNKEQNNFIFSVKE